MGRFGCSMFGSYVLNFSIFVYHALSFNISCIQQLSLYHGLMTAIHQVMILRIGSAHSQSSTNNKKDLIKYLQITSRHSVALHIFH